MVQTDVVYQGGLRTQARHAPSGATILTDAPVDNRGQGQAFSPTDLVAAALGSCVLTLMGITALDRGRELGEARVQVQKLMKAEPTRHIGRLRVQISVPGDWSAEERMALEASARGCPVVASLGPSTQVEMSFEWTGAA